MAKQPLNRAVYFEGGQVYQNQREVALAPSVPGLRWLNRYRLVLASKKPYALSDWNVTCPLCGKKFEVKAEYGHQFTLVCDAEGCGCELDVDVSTKKVVRRTNKVDNDGS